MIKTIDKIIAYSFYLLFFLVPLVLYSKTSEVFEFNKMVLTYILTSIITFFWIAKMILSKKILFKKTIIDKFLIIFLISQFLSTLFSIDKRTSLLGYYSRFHGGLASTITYTLLYWAYVSNMNYQKTKKVLLLLLSSASIVSIWAIFEHFGKSFSCLIFPEFGKFDVSCWVQDVQNRVYATFGQPNWLAAWIITLIPISWSYFLTTKDRSIKKYFWLLLSIIFFITLLYTKSRSGILGFTAMAITYFGFLIYQTKAIKKPASRLAMPLALIISPLIFFSFTIETPWLESFRQILKINQKGNTIQENKYQSPALEVGGTESGKIRKIVWKGAIEIWKDNPLFGSGVETFAFSYYKHRPVEHNLVSEWNYLYNKAHNEYLNFAATTGSVGLLSYLLLIGSMIFLFFKEYQKSITSQDKESPFFVLAFFAGFISILVTNFFGFSVVPVAIQFFLLPSIAVSFNSNKQDETLLKERHEKPTNSQIIMLTLALLTLIYLLFSIGKYWKADCLYAKGKLENDSKLYTNSINTLLKAIKLSPNEAIFWDELASSTGSLAILFHENNDPSTANQLAKKALDQSNKAVSLSPFNIILKRSRVQILANLTPIDSNYLQMAKNTLIETSKLAPTDANIFYNLAIIYFKTGEIQESIEILKKTLNLKPNYKEARLALAHYYAGINDIESAKNEFKYILDNIGYDVEVESELSKLENQR